MGKKETSCFEISSLYHIKIKGIIEYAFNSQPEIEKIFK